MKHSSQDSNECFFLLLSPLCLFFSLSFTLHCSKNFTFSSTCGVHHCKRCAKSLKLVRSMKHSSQDSNECFFLLLSPLCLFFSLSFTLPCSKNFTFSSTCGEGILYFRCMLPLSYMRVDLTCGFSKQLLTKRIEKVNHWCVASIGSHGWLRD